MKTQRDMILEVVETRCFEQHAAGNRDGAGLFSREWAECLECKHIGMDVEDIVHAGDCFVGRVEALLLEVTV